MDYKGKIVLITGAYRGIGRNLSIHFAECGSNLIITYHHHEKETNLLKEELMNKYHIHVDSLYLSLENEDSIRDLYEFVKEKYQKIDILVNNASLSRDNFYLEKDKKEFMDVLEVNVVGTFLMIKYFTPIMNGYIFNISSTDGIDTGSVYSIDYNVSKSGINMLTKTMALDNPNTIISICPNWVDTESTKEIDKAYLDSELKRVNQRNLIDVNKVFEVINKCISENVITGSIIRIEGEKND